MKRKAEEASGEKSDFGEGGKRSSQGIKERKREEEREGERKNDREEKKGIK